MHTETLSDLMDFDTVILVLNGQAAQVTTRHHAPECYWEGFAHGGHIESGTGWALLDGYSGQYRYAGPIMHPSEYIGGNLERDILATDGYYVAIVCEDVDDPDNPAGWAIAYRPLEDH